MAKDEKALKGDKERRWKMEDGYFQISKVMQEQQATTLFQQCMTVTNTLNSHQL